MSINTEKIVSNETHDEERAFYDSNGLILDSCSFDGPADGESAVKESKNVTVRNTFCNLRYPFWHVDNLVIENCEMTEKCRAALWYSENVTVKNTKMHGIKAFRECSDVTISGCDIISPEFGWSVDNISIADSSAVSEYFMMRSKNIRFDNVRMKGKYSFQYDENAVFRNCSFDTKDAFWHTKNVTCYDCELKGEYLAWYSENLRLVNCKIYGTQPFCYCKNLVLENCTMEATDLAFERSSVKATILSSIDSVKNPYEGYITAPAIGEIIEYDPEKGCVIKINAN